MMADTCGRLFLLRRRPPPLLLPPQLPLRSLGKQLPPPAALVPPASAPAVLMLEAALLLRRLLPRSRPAGANGPRQLPRAPAPRARHPRSLRRRGNGVPRPRPSTGVAAAGPRPARASAPSEHAVRPRLYAERVRLGIEHPLLQIDSGTVFRRHTTGVGNDSGKPIRHNKRCRAQCAAARSSCCSAEARRGCDVSSVGSVPRRACSRRGGRSI